MRLQGLGESSRARKRALEPLKTWGQKCIELRALGFLGVLGFRV